MKNWLKNIGRPIVRHLATNPKFSYYYNRLQWWLRGRSYKDREISACYEVMYQELADLCLKGQPGRLLEFGCGDAYLLRKIYEKTIDTQLFGSDFSETQVKAAQHLLPTAHFEWQDIRSMTYHDKSFDVAIGVGVLMYLAPSQLMQALKELQRISDTVISVEMDCLYFNEKQKESFRLARDGRFDHDYRKCFEEAGFNIIECRRIETFYDSEISIGEMGHGLIVAKSH